MQRGFPVYAGGRFTVSCDARESRLIINAMLHFPCFLRSVSLLLHHDHVDKLCKTVAPHWQKPVQKQEQQMAGRAGIGFALSPDQCELGLLASPLASLSLFLSYLSCCGPYVFRSTQRLSIKL